MLQSPDDPDATYRQKNGQHSKGFTINGTETVNPENPVCNRNIMDIPEERRKIRPNVEALMNEF
jgi:hypothetical protein